MKITPCFCVKCQNQLFLKKVLLFSFLYAIIHKLSDTAKEIIEYPGVAKFGIALEWGSRGRWFESSHSDHRGVLSGLTDFLL